MIFEGFRESSKILVWGVPSKILKSSRQEWGHWEKDFENEAEGISNFSTENFREWPSKILKFCFENEGSTFENFYHPTANLAYTSSIQSHKCRNGVGASLSVKMTILHFPLCIPLQVNTTLWRIVWQKKNFWSSWKN